MALREGRIDAYEMIFRQWYPALCRFARTILSDADEAEDAVQRVFVQVWEKREVIAVEISVRAYLYRAVRNLCLNEIRHKKVRLAHVRETTSYPPQHAEPDDQSHEYLDQRLHAALDQLPPQCRQVFEMCRFEGKMYKEVADALGISVKTVENQMGKALRILRTALNDLMPLLMLMLADTP